MRGGIGSVSLTSYPSKYLVAVGLGGGVRSVPYFITPAKIPQKEIALNTISNTPGDQVKNPGNLVAPLPKLEPFQPVPQVKRRKGSKKSEKKPLPVATDSELKILTLPKRKTLASEQPTPKRSKLTFNIIPNRD